MPVTSLPSRERELKRAKGVDAGVVGRVAPLAGARIETTMCLRGNTTEIVAPLAGARIETRHPR